MTKFHRRRFLQTTSSGVAVGLGCSIGSWWNQVASAAGENAENNGRILVVVQLSGGNDGLNTVIPYGDTEYFRNRLTLSYNPDSILKIDDYLGWHPSAGGMASLLESGDLAIIQGVGYPNPNRSHFESMDLWHTAHATGKGTGWLGRLADQELDPETPQSVHVGRGVRPLALQARNAIPLTIGQVDQFRIAGNQKTKDFAVEVSKTCKEDNPLVHAISSNLQAALKADAQLAKVLRSTSGNGYKGGEIGRDLQQVSTMIKAGLPAKIYYLTLDGFDTHANQRNAHAALLDQLSSGLQSFCDDMRTSGLLDRVLVMCFSEFGRRVKENGSQGTDHGVAGPMFVVGGRCRGGLYGKHPSLTDLDEGDLKHSVDYRSVYTTILSRWLDADVSNLIDGAFDEISGLIV